MRERKAFEGAQRKTAKKKAAAATAQASSSLKKHFEMAGHTTCISKLRGPGKKKAASEAAGQAAAAVNHNLERPVADRGIL